MSTCRSCSAPVTWAITAGGKRMPVDAEPSENGNLFLEGDGDGGWLVWTSHSADVPLYTSHFATCPNAAGHRR